MSATKGILSGGRALTRWIQKDATEGTLLQRIITAINTTADNNASSAVGRLAPPPPVNGVTVKVAGEFAHVQIAHAGAIQQGIRYFTEVATNQNFAQPLVIDHGTSRTSHPFPLPTKTDSGATQKYYFRSYCQYPGSDPSAPVAYGGASPIAVQMAGSTQMTLLPSTGSGTAANTGQQGSWGLGKQQRRS